MRQMFKTILAGIAAVAIASVVVAQTPAPKSAAVETKKPILQKMDQNQDGKVTKKEHQSRLKEWFKKLDKKADGKVTPEEFGGDRFVNIDVNKDGTITVEEYLVFFVGKEALAKAVKIKESKALYPKGSEEITGADVIAYRKGVFKAINASADGKLTPKEMKKFTEKVFKFLDKNKDRFITEDEITAVAVIPVFAPKAKDKKAEPAAKK